MHAKQRAGGAGHPLDGCWCAFLLSLAHIPQLSRAQERQLLLQRLWWLVVSMALRRWGSFSAMTGALWPHLQQLPRQLAIQSGAMAGPMMLVSTPATLRYSPLATHTSRA